MKDILLEEKGSGPIGVFDSGYGGLTVFKEIVDQLPQYDYLYLGDNARSPYGTRSFETIYQYTLEAVRFLFDKGCRLVILACNTASARALRNIQRIDLPQLSSKRRVLGIIRPTTEIIGKKTESKSIGILATSGTVASKSYPIEIQKFFPDVKVYQQACPMWVPLVENEEYNSDGADFFIKKYLDELFAQSNTIDTVLLACTHYPLLLEKIQQYLPKGKRIVLQGDLVALSLANYLERHPEISQLCTEGATQTFYTTDSADNFMTLGSQFWGSEITATQITY